MRLPNRHFRFKYRNPIGRTKEESHPMRKTRVYTGAKETAIQVGSVPQFGEHQPKRETKRSEEV